MYKETHDKLIRYRLDNPLFKIKKDGKLHVHHIIQRYQGGDDNESNLIILTIREHRIIHWLLWKINGNFNDLFAYNRLGGSHQLTQEAKNHLSRVNKDRWNNMSEEAKQATIDRLRPFTLLPKSKKTRELLSKLKKESKAWAGEDNPFYGSSRTGEDNPMHGKTHSGESRNKMRKSKNFSEETLSNLSKHGKSLVGSKNPNARPVTYKGLHFDTLKQAAEHFGMGRDAMRNRLNKI
jgi:hypothetical protein